MSLHALTSWDRSGFETLSSVGDHLGASVGESQQMLAALGLWPCRDESLALGRVHWCRLSAVRSLRCAFDTLWDELTAELAPPAIPTSVHAALVE